MAGGETTEAGVRSIYQRSFSAGEIIFDEGDPGDALYVIELGVIELTRSGPDGVRKVDSLGPGEFFGEMSVVLGGRRSVCARAVLPTRVLELDGSTLEEMCVERPEIALRLVRRLAARVIELEKQVFAPSVEHALPLVLRVLLRRAEATEDGGARIPVTLRQLAEEAGLSLAEVHDALQSLFARKLLRLSDGVLHAADLAALEDEIESASGAS